MSDDDDELQLSDRSSGILGFYFVVTLMKRYISILLHGLAEMLSTDDE